ncbi:hypothetical protein IGI04_030858 [Brassica rapa subsp. trilocularis]|uniref:Uncharacterized protein n=1 Tax=Brassica rapa subsp. trilocularis TaxID=1813537 RepID=A0ABQ7LRY3_BRACM|nr:hypothetical protein IGI04_030858 [Brassica rapa subsp. trilocularis]
MDFGQTSIDDTTDTSSDESIEETMNTSLLESIDTIEPEVEHPFDHIEKLEDLMEGTYNYCKLFSFSLVGDARRSLDQLPA